uniref:PPPDE domain-containing protein n=1 Tax=Corethron hystrix TaxID=216773 RepID=A0A7S1G1G3_9STRA|mmetsp:Transcript_8139/g.17686  ORF Transcript_8139/g.17686 Transcript_8139/m.17686 type:complete len:170 (+) Transcript_8139:178-687(+)
MTRLTKVQVFLEEMSRDNAHGGFLGTLDWFGSVLNPWQHPPGRFQSWMTHFFLVLEYCDSTIWILERMNVPDDGGVAYCKADCWARERVESGHGTLIWEGEKDNQEVKDFIQGQQQFSYNGISKNCQHFAYDFFQYCLHDNRAMGKFEHFTETCQALYRQSGGGHGRKD